MKEHKKSTNELEQLVDQLHWMSIGGSNRNKFAKIGEFTIGREFGDLTSDDLNRRPVINSDLDLKVGKKRRGRYSQNVLGKK